MSNLIDIVAALTDQTPQQVADGIGTYGQLKATTADVIIEALDPIRRRHDELVGDPAELRGFPSVVPTKPTRSPART